VSIGCDIVELQNLIGYSFSDISLLEMALTHSSYANEQRAIGNAYSSYERLEFLGDAVLEMLVSEYLYFDENKFPEGALTKIRQRLVCEKTLSKIGKALKLGKFVNLGKDGEKADCRNSGKIIADVLEAIFGAIYLDALKSGRNDYKDVILSLISREITSLDRMQKCDYKTMLKQLVEKDGASVLEYRVLAENGPEHDKSFTIGAFVNNNVVGRGTASTKKDAEMNASHEALRLFGFSD
jgi:ribonuclease-3